MTAPPPLPPVAAADVSPIAFAEEQHVPSSPRDAYNTVDGFVSEVVARLSERLPDLVDVMCRAVQQELPAYRRPAADVEEFRGGVRRTAGLLMRVLEERRPLRPEELVTLHVIGAQRARQGIPADWAVEGVRVGLRVGWEYLLGIVRELPLTDVALQAVGRMSLEVFDFVHVVLTGLETGYATEQEQRLTGQVQAQAAFVDRVLEGHWDDEREIRSQAAGLGHELGGSWGMLFVLPAGSRHTEALRSAAAAVATATPGIIEGPMRTLPTLHVVLLCTSSGPAAWCKALDAVNDVAVRERLVVVPAEPVPLAHTLVHVYRRAQRYLTLANTAGSGPGIVTVKDLRLYAVLAGVPLADRVEFVRDVLGPILDLVPHKAKELLETLEAVYRRKGRIADAAADLHLHQNSVRYRLNRIEALTGLSLDVPAERMHLELAMRLRWVAAAELATLDDPPSPTTSRSLPA